MVLMLQNQYTISGLGKTEILSIKNIIHYIVPCRFKLFNNTSKGTSFIMCIKVLYIFQQYVWWMFNTDNIHNTKKHQSPFVIKASLMSHHTKSLTRKTTCQQIKIRQFSDSFNRFCKMNNIPHYHLIFRIVIGTIGLNSLSIYLRISHMLKSCNLIPAKNIHSSTESANAGKSSICCSVRRIIISQTSLFPVQ